MSSSGLLASSSTRLSSLPVIGSNSGRWYGGNHRDMRRITVGVDRLADVEYC